MLFNILLCLLCFLYSDALARSESSRAIKQLSYTEGPEYAQVINSYDFDTKPYEVEILSECFDMFKYSSNLVSLQDHSGYIYCVTVNTGIEELCPPGTKVTYEIGGCVNTTTNTTVLPTESRCAENPCQNTGFCFDFRSADSYICLCDPSYIGLHCDLKRPECPGYACGKRTSQMVPSCRPYTSDLALPYTCNCYFPDPSEKFGLALNNCHDKNQLFFPICETANEIGAVPFTNKGFYSCQGSIYSVVESCPLDHIWNDTRKECVFQNV